MSRQPSAPAVRVDRSTLELGAVIEYFTEPGLGEFCDPRKHAVSLTYSAACDVTGEPEPQGEAYEFRWFGLDQLPGLDFGFGQGEVVARVTQEARTDLATGGRRGPGTLSRGPRERAKLAT